MTGRCQVSGVRGQGGRGQGAGSGITDQGPLRSQESPARNFATYFWFLTLTTPGP